MPDRGIWTLRCPNCNEVSTVEIKPGERLLTFLHTYICPHCKQKRDAARQPHGWGIVDFKPNWRGGA